MVLADWRWKLRAASSACSLKMAVLLRSDLITTFGSISENPVWRVDPMEQETSFLSRRGMAYNLFIFILTIISLVIMVVMLLPLDDSTIGLLQVYDNLICAIFLLDFFINLRASPKKSDYLIKERGWLDLLGSIPSLGVAFKYSGLFRLARLSRLTRIARLLGRKQRGDLLREIVQKRGEYAAFITILMTLIILSSASVLVLQFEGRSPDANIKTGWDAFWYSVVTITTVGYGDRYPVTPWGRVIAMFIMFMGVGIIGALASILSSVLVGSPGSSAKEEKIDAEMVPGVEQELQSIKNELAEMHQLLEKISREIDEK
jgi:voltage-gated potassium channel